GSHRWMLPLVGADFALEHFHRTGLGPKRFVIPSLDRRKAEHDPLAGDGVLPLFGCQFLELLLQLPSLGRGRQKRSDDAEAKMCPALMRPRGGGGFVHRMLSVLVFSTGSVV